MPSSKGYKDLESGAVGGINAILNEALGTCFLGLTLFGAAGGGFDKTLAVGGMLAFFYWWEADGHYNPAVTVSTMVGSNPSSSVRGGLLAIVGQMAGGAIAALISSILMSSPVSYGGAGDLSTGLTDALLTLIVLMSWTSSTNGLERGLVYFAGLSALSSQLGANASVVLGVVLANAATGGGLNLGMGTLVGAGAPLVTAALWPVLSNVMYDTLPKLTNGLNKAMMPELLGAFFFALLYFSIAASDDGLGSLTVGLALTATHTLFPTAALNPLVTFAGWVKARKFDTWMDPILITLAQTVGVALAAIVGSFVGVSASVPAPSTLGSSAALEALFSVVLGLLYLSFGNRMTATTAGLGYFACVSSFASSFNPALHLGTVVAGLVGFGGGGAFAVTTTAVPLAGAAIAGIVHGATSNDVNEAIGAFVVIVTVSSGTATTALTLGAMTAALSTIYVGGTFNPALLASNVGGHMMKIGYQLAGSLAGGLFVAWAGLGGNVSLADGLGGYKIPAAELLLLVLLVKVYKDGGESAGLAYFALLTIFGGAAGSIGNPATALGGWLANGLLGSGFDLSLNALISITSHVLAPMAGGFLSARAFGAFDDLGGLLGKAGLSGTEFVGSFLLVLATSGVSGAPAATSDLAYAVAVMVVLDLIYTADTADLFPAISAARTLGDGIDVLGLLKKLAAQTLGAVAAAVLAGWLLGTSVGGDADGAISTTLLNGTLWGALLGWLYKYAQGTLGFAVGLFAIATTFGSYNGASLLGAALLSADFAFLTSPAWLATFGAPLLGGILSARLPALLGK